MTMKSMQAVSKLLSGVAEVLTKRKTERDTSNIFVFTDTKDTFCANFYQSKLALDLPVRTVVEVLNCCQRLATLVRNSSRVFYEVVEAGDIDDPDLAGNIFRGKSPTPGREWELVEEANYLALLGCHPGIIRSLGLIEHELGPFLLLEPNSDMTLSQFLGRKVSVVMSPRRRLLSIVQLCEALAFMHAMNIGHGAISPHSIRCRGDPLKDGKFIISELGHATSLVPDHVRRIETKPPWREFLFPDVPPRLPGYLCLPPECHQIPVALSPEEACEAVDLWNMTCCAYMLWFFIDESTHFQSLTYITHRYLQALSSPEMGLRYLYGTTLDRRRYVDQENGVVNQLVTLFAGSFAYASSRTSLITFMQGMAECLYSLKK